jgi:hypothetical protein
MSCDGTTSRQAMGLALFSRREERDVVAEAGRVDDHEIGACRYLFDPAYPVGRLGMAVELWGIQR